MARRPARRPVIVIAESAANDARLVTREGPKGASGCDAQWDDDFHHALHALLTGERDGYYADFGRVSDLAPTYRDGVRRTRTATRRSATSVTAGPRRACRASASSCSTRTTIRSATGRGATGSPRWSASDGARVAAAAVLLAPFVPLLFMGEEYGETNPFPYFVSHGDPELVEAVRRGRAEEFGLDPDHAVDPQAEATFLSAKLDWDDAGASPMPPCCAGTACCSRLRAERPGAAEPRPDPVHRPRPSRTDALP